MTRSVWMMGALVSALALGCDDGGDDAVDGGARADMAADVDGGGGEGGVGGGVDLGGGAMGGGVDLGGVDMGGIDMGGIDMGGVDMGGGDDGVVEPDGAAAFAAQCAACHGPDGGGLDGLGPDVRNPADWGYATYVVRNGRDEIAAYPGAMLAFDEAALDPPTLDAMLSWLGEAEKPADGPGLYARFCANCHDADGSGGRARHAVTNEDEVGVIQIVREGHGGTRYGDARAFMPAFDLELLTDPELDLIIAYIDTL